MGGDLPSIARCRSLSRQHHLVRRDMRVVKRQAEVGSRNDADVELGQWEGVCDMKRPAWNCVFQLKDKKI